jgi:hypothetical protein
VMLTAYTARQAQLLDAHCDLLLSEIRWAR